MSRIGIRGILAAMMTSSALMLILMSVVAAIGFWNYMPKQLTELRAGFWIMSSIAWALSLFVAGFVAASSSHSKTTADGVLNALAACSGSFLFFAISFVLLSPNALNVVLAGATVDFFEKVFYANVFSFVAGAYGGVAGVRFENRHPSTYSRKIPVSSYQ